MVLNGSPLEKAHGGVLSVQFQQEPSGFAVWDRFATGGARFIPPDGNMFALCFSIGPEALDRGIGNRPTSLAWDRPSVEEAIPEMCEDELYIRRQGCGVHLF